MLFYHSVISEDEDTQRHGLVVIFAGSAENIEYLPREQVGDLIKIYKSFPERMAVNHQCLPDGPQYQILKAIWMILLASKDQRIRTKFHDDLSNLETQYNLMSFGIPIHHIPRTSTGNIKLKNNQQWIKTRNAIDKARENSSDPSRLECGIIQNPGRHDVLFSRGGNATYSGNLEFQQDMSERMKAFKSFPDKDSRQRVRQEVIDCVKARGGRFLYLVKGGWWEQVPLDKIHEKITTSFYDLSRRMDSKETNQRQVTSSATNMFLNESNKRQKVEKGGLTCNFLCV